MAIIAWPKMLKTCAVFNDVNPVSEKAEAAVKSASTKETSLLWEAGIKSNSDPTIVITK